MLAAIALLTVGLVILLVSGLGGDEAERATDEATVEARSEPEPLPEDGCIDRWNNSDFPGREQAASQAERGDVYARVTFANDFPDKCLIILALADVGAGFATIWRESSGDNAFQLVNATPVNQLTDVDKQWNAKVSSNGTISLGYP